MFRGLHSAREGTGMPIYEYSCLTCGHEFELLVLKATVPSCPSCNGEELEKRLSLPSVRSKSTRDLALKSARKRDAKLGDDRVREQIEYRDSHD
jgi:putative FmdB family regulatory protein